MLLVSRITTFKAGIQTGLGLAMEFHSLVNELLDVEVGLYVGGAGYPGGTFIYSAVAENMSHAQGEDAKLLASKKYLDLTEKAAALAVAPTETKLRAIVSMAPETPSEISVGSTVSILSARIRSGKAAEAMKFGVDVTAYVNQGANIPVGFTRNVAGDPSEVTWLGIAENAATLDQALTWEATDAGYQQRYASASEFFVEGSAHRGFITRVA